MLWLRGVLASNQTGLMLVQGQAFFVLGLSIVLLTRRRIRLELADELAPLAAFAFCEAGSAWVSAWLGVVAPASWLEWSRLMLLALGYALLAAFALQVYMPADRRDRDRWWAAVGLVLVWALGLVVVGFAGFPEGQVRVLGEIGARYGLALPGSLLSAWALHREMHRTIDPGHLPVVKSAMRFSALALVSFALFGGLIGPGASFVPASLLDESVLFETTGIPISLLRTFSGAALALGVVKALSAVLNQIGAWLESVERMQALGEERQRIGRELHDGTIQSIYASGLILQGVRQNLVANPDKARDQLTQAISNLNKAMQDIRRYIFDLRGELPQDDLEMGLRRILKDFRVNTLLDTRLVIAGDGARGFDAERRQHIFQIAREALTNVARHAHARRVDVSLEYESDLVRLRISDDGVGLAGLPGNNGHGLRNIRERTRLLNGRLDIDSGPKQGLTLVLTVPYQQRVVSTVHGGADPEA